jgi:hypothetical protein
MNQQQCCIKTQSLQGFAMPNPYRQNYTPDRPLPRWLKRIINWL